MSDLTIREASQLIGRTAATIRRYIRSGRLKADKEVGKFGEEYRIRRDDLLALGFSPADPDERPSTELVLASNDPPPLAPTVAVPISLYNELLMKHEQLLVQYGMIRAGGQKLFEYKAEAEARVGELARAEERYQLLRARVVREIGLLRKRLRQSEAQVEERKIEITLLEDKIRRLEVAAAGAATHEGFETRITEIREKERSIAELSGRDYVAGPAAAPIEPWAPGGPPGRRKEDH